MGLVSSISTRLPTGARDEVEWVDEHLRFKGRIEREEWIPQCKLLADGDMDQFNKLYGTGGCAIRKGAQGRHPDPPQRVEEKEVISNCLQRKAECRPFTCCCNSSGLDGMYVHVLAAVAEAPCRPWPFQSARRD
jgi:hypothetical protein